MRILTLSSLYPNAAQPHHGVFVENRMRRLAAREGVYLRVVAPVPWFPFSHPWFGAWAAFPGVPREEERFGIRISHPRYLMLPGAARFQAGSYARSVLPHIRRIIAAEGPFDLIDAHYFYPDGVAAMYIAAALGIPYTVTARGSDISQIPHAHPALKPKILAAAQNAAHSITVCRALKDELVVLGADESRITPLRNGVDLEMFRPLDKHSARARLNLPPDAPVIVSIGGLIERKGHYLAIEAISALEGVHFLIAGDGPDKAALEAQIAGEKVGERIRLLGRVPHDQLAQLYSAADISLLASSREGWANVLLESMACGTPVAATAIWGTPEVIQAPEAGVLIQERNVVAIRAGVAELLATRHERSATRAYAEQFSWDATIDRLEALFRRIISQA